MERRISSSSIMKSNLRKNLLSEDVNQQFSLGGYSPRLVLSALFSFYFDRDQLLRWRAIKATGEIVANMADENMESARIVMRRLMWTLNDESGGIGWGSPEAMGEIMACHPRLADEYHRILISYLMEDGNYLEHEVLQRGALWAVARLAEVRPDLCAKAKGLEKPYFSSEDKEIRGLAAMLAGLFRNEDALGELESLTSDESMIEFYENCEIRKIKLSKIAADAISAIKNKTPEA